MRVQIAGLGKVGSSFAKFLRKFGIDVLTYRVRTGEGMLEDADLLFIAVRDDVIKDVAKSLYDRGRKYSAVGHFSGALTSDVLKPFQERFSLHPIQAFNEDDPSLWSGITATYEGTPKAKEYVTDLASKIGLRVIEIPAEKKTLYHSACVFVSNLIYAPLIAGEEIFSSLGLRREDYRLLIEVSFKNFVEKGIEGLTGPLVRGDIETIEKHLKNLHFYASEDIYDLYKTLTTFIKHRLNKR